MYPEMSSGRRFEVIRYLEVHRDAREIPTAAVAVIRCHIGGCMKYGPLHSPPSLIWSIRIILSQTYGIHTPTCLCYNRTYE